MGSWRVEGSLLGSSLLLSLSMASEDDSREQSSLVGVGEGGARGGGDGDGDGAGGGVLTILSTRVGLSFAQLSLALSSADCS